MTVRIVTVALALLLATAGQPAAAQQALEAVAADAAVHAKAFKLAKTVQPPEVAIDGSLRSMDAQMVDALLGNPDVKKLEGEHPGIVAAMWVGARPLMRDIMVEELPNLWQILARYYAAHFTAAELDRLDAFYSSSVGKKMVVALHTKTDLKPMVKDAMNEGGKIKAETYVEEVIDVTHDLAAEMTAQELGELTRLMASPLGAKMRAAAPEITKLGVEWMNKPAPERDAKIQQAMMVATEAFLAEKAKKQK